MLLAASTAERRGERADELAAILAGLDWEALAKRLRTRRLLATLGPRLIEAGDGAASPEFVATVDEALLAGRRQGMFLTLVGDRARGALTEAGIDSAPLKGPQLADALWGDAGRRLSNDIDLLVAPDRLDAAAAAMRALDYGPAEDHREANGLPLLHLSLYHVRGELPPIELHWRIHWYEESFAQDRLLRPEEIGSSPDSVADLAALLLFYARDGFVDIRLAADLAAWWDRFGEGLDPGALARLIDDHPAYARVLPAAVRAAERTVGLPAGRILPGSPALGLRQRAAVRLVNPNPAISQAQLFAEIGLVDGLLAPPGGFPSFVRRNVLPHREVLQVHAAAANRERPHTVLVRGIGVVSRYLLALARLLRSDGGHLRPAHRARPEGES